MPAPRHQTTLANDEESDSDDEVEVSINQNVRNSLTRPNIEDAPPINVVDVTVNLPPNEPRQNQEPEPVHVPIPLPVLDPIPIPELESLPQFVAEPESVLELEDVNIPENDVPIAVVHVQSVVSIEVGEQPIANNAYRADGKRAKYFLPKWDNRRRPNEVPLPDANKLDNPDTVMIDWSDTDDDDDDNNEDGKYAERLYDEKIVRRRFKPKLYDFVIEDYNSVRDTMIANEHKFDDNIIIRCPEFAIMLDHAIAVIWYFYRDWNYWNTFNVPQLEWAIKFLDGIASQAIHYHIELIVQQLRDLLFINYTEVSRKLVAIPKPKLTKTESKDSKNSKDSKPQSNITVSETILPISLEAMLDRAPQFRKHLSTTPIVHSAKSAADLNAYATARVQLLKNELSKLITYEKRSPKISQNIDTELMKIINKIKIHADEIVEVRQQIVNH